MSANILKILQINRHFLEKVNVMSVRGNPADEITYTATVAMLDYILANTSLANEQVRLG